MLEQILSSPFFGLVLTVFCWCSAVWLQKKTGLLVCNPVLVASLLGILVLVMFRIPLECYNAGGDIIHMMLAPATAVLALNIYQQRKILRENFFPVLTGCAVGSAVSIVLVLVLCRVFLMGDVFVASMLPKSVTTAIAVGICESKGGIAGLTAVSVAITGMEGAVLAPMLAKYLRITDPVAEGVAIGACSHAIGTTKALEIGQLQGAMSSIAICVSGVFTSVIAMFI